MQSWNEGLDFKELVLNNQEIMKHISTQELQQAFDLNIYTANVDYIFQRCGLED
jgi:adenylosuccinate lyase